MTLQTPGFNTPRASAFMSASNQPLQRYEYHTPVLNQWQYLLAAIRDKGPTKQWVTLINPPFIPNDRYLQEIGLDQHYIRIVRLCEHNPSIKNYIQRCLINGKSALVAIWSTQPDTLPEILQSKSGFTCRTLLFSNEPEPQHSHLQLELLF